MTKTENGNSTLTFEEFAEAVRKIVPIADGDSLKESYERIRRRYYISSNSIGVALPAYADSALRYIKAEKRHLYKAITIWLSYDAGPLDFVPQDCPYEMLLVNTETGEAITTTEIYEWLREQKGEGEMKLIIGISLAFIDLALIIAGVTCLIITSLIDTVSALTDFMLLFGWLSTGAGIGSALALVSAFLIITADMK